MTDFLILFASYVFIAGIAYWFGWDNRGDVEWNRRHGIDQEPGT